MILFVFSEDGAMQIFRLGGKLWIRFGMGGCIGNAFGRVQLLKNRRGTFCPRFINEKIVLVIVN